MISTTERRHGENARIPCAIPVELSPDAGRPGFAAAAVDLSAGGLSLRASSLPEVGATLHCQFETLPGGTRVSGRGEVVWAKLSGERSGEFGLRFTDIQPEAQALIAEMIAERVAQSQSDAPREPRMATLEFEHVESPITAKLTRAAGRDVVFEQPLGVLALGSGVIAHSDKNLGHGNLLRVDLRMDGGTPTLALTVRFSDAQEEYGEYDWGEPETGPQPKSAPAGLEASSPIAQAEVDTVPDLAAPLGVFDSTPPPPPTAASDPGHDREDTEPDAVPQLELAPRTTLVPGGLPVRTPLPSRTPLPRRVSPTPASQPGLVRGHSAEYLTAQDYEEIHDDEPSVHEYPAMTVEGLEPEAESSAGYDDSPQLSASKDDLRLRHGENDENGEDDEDTWDRVSDSARKSPLVRFLRIFAAIENAAQPAVALSLRLRDRARNGITSYLHRRPLRRTALTGTLRGVGAASATRTRRSAGAPMAEPVPKWTRGIGRLALLAVLMAGAGMLLVYALAPSPAAEEIELHRTVEAETEAETETSLSAATDPDFEPAAVGGAEPKPAAPASPRPQAAKATAKPSLVSAPAAAGAKPGTLVFGHKNVPNAQRFLLRMTAPIASLRGKSVPGGFSVVISGTRAVDKAAPIAASAKSVARAQILNRGNSAELTVLFVDGKSPAYRVSAQPAGLEVSIGP